MACPCKQPAKQRVTHLPTAHVTLAELAHVERQAIAAGLTAAESLRRLALGATVASCRARAVIGPMAAHIVMPAIHRVFSNLKVWALGVYHGLRRKHLGAYLDEFAFRFNRRKSRHAAFATLLGIATASKPAPYNMLRAVGSTGC